MSDEYGEVTIEGGPHDGETYIISPADLGRTPAIHVEGTKDADHCHVTIANNVISRDGFEPLTDAVRELSGSLKFIGWSLVAVAMVALWIIAS